MQTNKTVSVHHVLVSLWEGPNIQFIIDSGLLIWLLGLYYKYAVGYALTIMWITLHLLLLSGVLWYNHNINQWTAMPHTSGNTQHETPTLCPYNAPRTRPG